MGDFFDTIGIDLINGYGITECSPLVSANMDYCNDCSTVGFPLECVEIKLEDVTPEGDGEICVKGDIVMLGYYKQPEKTAEVLQNGWFRTGDYGKINDKGQLMITGRKKNLIVLDNGKNVFPEEIETLLNKVEGIKETFVFEKKEDDGDVKVCVEIVYDKELIKELYNIEGEENIKEFLWDKVKEVNKLMPKYKYVREMVITEEPLIKTTTLKIKRHEELKKVLGK